MSETTDESTKLISDIETKLEGLEEPDIEKRVRAVMKELLGDVHERFVQIENAVGIRR